MKKFAQALALLLLLPLFSAAQHLEAGILVGASNYLGDLSNNSSTIYLGETKPAVGILAKYNFSDFVAARLGLNYTRLAGRDANVRNDDYIRQRNLSFRSSVLEFSLIGEFNILGYQPYGLSAPFSPYIFAGVAAAKFNPKARYLGNWVALPPLQTEGESYGLVTLAIPFGIGAKYALNDKINLGLELGARRTFTDYLDDVSGDYFPEGTSAALGDRSGELQEPLLPRGVQRGDEAKADWYFILGATVTYNFMENGLMGSRGRSKRKAGCKTD